MSYKNKHRSKVPTSVEVRYPRLREGFALTGVTEFRHCLIFNGPGLTQRYLPVEGEASKEICDWAALVIFHHAVSDMGEPFALPEIRTNGVGNCHLQLECLEQILQEKPGTWLGIDHNEEFGEFLYGIGWDEEPRPISRLKFSALLEKTLAHYVIDAIDHPWVKQLRVGQRLGFPRVVQSHGPAERVYLG